MLQLLGWHINLLYGLIINFNLSLLTISFTSIRQLEVQHSAMESGKQPTSDNILVQNTKTLSKGPNDKVKIVYGSNGEKSITTN